MGTPRTSLRFVVGTALITSGAMGEVGCSKPRVNVAPPDSQPNINTFGDGPPRAPQEQPPADPPPAEPPVAGAPPTDAPPPDAPPIVNTRPEDAPPDVGPSTVNIRTADPPDDRKKPTKGKRPPSVNTVPSG